jgi:hypothetical protein
MSSPETEPPIMALDGRHLQTVTQVALTLGDVLQRRRRNGDRRAFSDAEHAARRLYSTVSPSIAGFSGSSEGRYTNHSIEPSSSSVWYSAT